MSDSQFLAGLVVTRRRWQPVEGRGRKNNRGARTGWTLHRDDCPHLVRKQPSDLLPAPRQAYLDTIECPLCKPADRHHAKWRDTGDGRVEASCTACDITATAANSNAALSSMGRQHLAQRDRETLAAALASGETPERVVTRRNGGNDAWTLHRPTCVYVGRSKSVLPAPTPLTAGTQACVYCRPNDDEVHHNEYQNVDGVVLAACTTCDLTATGATPKSAGSSLKRKHEAAVDRAALDDAVAGGERPALVVTRRRQRAAVAGSTGSGWTLHRLGCWQSDRAHGVRPAPDPLEPGTVACTYCRPERADGMPARAVA